MYTQDKPMLYAGGLGDFWSTLSDIGKTVGVVGQTVYSAESGQPSSTVVTTGPSGITAYNVPTVGQLGQTVSGLAGVSLTTLLLGGLVLFMVMRRR